MRIDRSSLHNDAPPILFTLFHNFHILQCTHMPDPPCYHQCVDNKVCKRICPNRSTIRKTFTIIQTTMLGDDQHRHTHMQNTFGLTGSKKWHKRKKSAGRGRLGIIWPRRVPPNFIQMGDSLLKSMQLATKGWILVGPEKLIQHA